MANEDDIDYTAEGATPPEEKEDPTNAGYDEAVQSGPGEYGVKEGEGGVFGTTGGGTFGGGMHVEERPVIEGTERGPDEVTPVSPLSGATGRESRRDH
ncbi:MAG: hypothetical protein DMF58_04275 [Acidobacteria bacterium]|nr:MAG: hypothetical protein DMF58_04275 [Acidobacteriota bacterium]